MLACALPRSALRTAARLPLRTAQAARPSPPAFAFASLRWASTKRFTEDHEWIEYEDSSKIGTVGITDYAQKSLGDVTFVELPTADTDVEQGEQMGSVESVKAASDIFAPVSGKVKEVNTKLEDQANLVNRSPEGEGWLVKIELTEAAQLEKLLDADAYAAHCEGQDQ